MQLGAICVGSKTSFHEAFHYIVYLSGDIAEDFVGAIVTRSSKGENIPMCTEHFETRNEQGSSYDFQFNNTHLVPQRLIKLKDWGPYSQVGMLTPKGIKFVEDAVSSTQPIPWHEYMSQKRSIKEK